MTIVANRFNPLFWLGFGLAAWIISALAIRFVGQWLFTPDTLFKTFLVFGLSVPIMVLLMLFAYRWQGVQPSERLQAATYTFIPAMILDTLAVINLGFLFPNLLPEAYGLFAAWLLWGNAVGLATGLTRG